MHSELLARLEAATADKQRELLVEVWHAINPLPCLGDRDSFDDWKRKKRRFIATLDAEAYESAALTLVPDGWRIGMEMGARNDMEPSKTVVWCWPFESFWEPDWQMGQQTQHDNPDGLKALAPTPALAIVIAALRAKGDA